MDDPLDRLLGHGQTVQTRSASPARRAAPRGARRDRARRCSPGTTRARAAGHPSAGPAPRRGGGRRGCDFSPATSHSGNSAATIWQSQDSSGASGRIPSAARRAAASASERPAAARTSSQSCSARKSIAAGTERHAAGSYVPGQRCLAPNASTRARSSRRRAARAPPGARAVPRGSPRPSARRATCGSCRRRSPRRATRGRGRPDRARARRRPRRGSRPGGRGGRSPRPGRRSAVAEVMWLTEITRVRGVTPLHSSSTRPGPGSTARRTSVAPVRTQTCSQRKSTAPYSWFESSTSSPRPSSSERATTFIPAVALGTKTRSSGRAPRYVARRAFASSISSG